MSRVTRGYKANRRRKKVFKLAKGFHFDRRNKFRHTIATVKRALANSYKGRKQLKRTTRNLWIVRIGAAAKNLGGSYSKFMGQLKKQNIQLNRKMLAEIAATDEAGFSAIFRASNQ